MAWGCDPASDAAVVLTAGASTLLRRSFSLLADLLRLQQMKTTTAMTTVPQIAALAAMMILSMCVEA